MHVPGLEKTGEDDDEEVEDPEDDELEYEEP